MLTGSRIRARRLAVGAGQGALAAEVGISASYLNLIEHNRRRIGGKLLASIARALALDPGVLAAGDMALIGALQQAAAGHGAAGDAGAGPQIETDGAGDFAGRFPGWAGLVTAQATRIDRLEGRIADLTARLTHDPALAASLHDVISAVTAIRSTAAILVSGEGIDPDWQARFHRNINADARRLADVARALVDYLERPEDKGDPRTPQEEFDRWLEGAGWHLPQVEAGGDVALPGGAAAALAQVWVDRYRADALALPLAVFSGRAEAMAYDPASLAAHFGQPLAVVLRRLACLPADTHPPMGLAICDAAGGLTVLKPVAGFTLPRRAAACPLWPLYQALGQPGRPVRADLTVAGGRGLMLRGYAVAAWLDAGFDLPPRIEAVMLVQGGGADGGAGSTEVGQTCRLCPRQTCPARREPSILG